jgi:hypothetical protein
MPMAPRATLICKTRSYTSCMTITEARSSLRAGLAASTRVDLNRDLQSSQAHWGADMVVSVKDVLNCCIVSYHIDQMSRDDNRRSMSIAEQDKGGGYGLLAMRKHT